MLYTCAELEIRIKNLSLANSPLIMYSKFVTAMTACTWYWICSEIGLLLSSSACVHYSEHLVLNVTTAIIGQYCYTCILSTTGESDRSRDDTGHSTEDGI